MKINQKAYTTKKPRMNQGTIYNIRKLIQIKRLIVVVATLIISQNVLATPSVFAYCGKKVVCQWDHTCTMLDGDYGLFKTQVSGTGDYSPIGTFSLKKVVIYNKSWQAVCYYETPPNMAVQSWSLPNNRFGVAQSYPASTGWVYNDPDTVPSNGENIYVCDASKFECRMEHWY